MSQQPLTYESVLKLIRKDSRIARKEMAESRRAFDQRMAESEQAAKRRQEEYDQRQEELNRLFKETDKKISALGNRLGDLVEGMIGDGIVRQFQALNIDINAHSRDKKFGIKDTNESGQIDVFLENGDVVILISVKTKLTNDDVREHIEQLEKYRIFGNDQRRILGAVAGGVAADNVVRFAHKKGLFVIVQSGDAVVFVPTPKGFKAKKW